MRNLTGLFRHPGVPCNDERISQIEANINRQLPLQLRALIKQTGGGILSASARIFPGDYAPHSYPKGVEVDQIFGNGRTAKGLSNNLDEESLYLSKEWGLPEGVVLFAVSEAGMYECFAINYDLKEFSPLSVLYIDTDRPESPVEVASSVEEFIDGLSPDPEAPKDFEASRFKAIEMEGIREGELSPDLSHAIAASSLEDGEAIIRSAAERVGRGPKGLMVENNENGRMLLDVFFWFLSQARPITSATDFYKGEPAGKKPNFRTMVAKSFRKDQSAPGLSYAAYIFPLWWERRLENGILKQINGTYHLDDDYIIRLFNDLRKDGRPQI